MPHRPTFESGFFVVAAVACAASAAVGIATAVRPFQHKSSLAAERAARARFFESCRPLVPKGAPVVAICSTVPAPDFDYWFSFTKPVAILVIPDMQQIAREAGLPAPPDAAALRAELDRRGVLFTTERLEAAISGGGFVIIDLAAAAAEGPAAPRAGWTPVATDGTRSLWKL